MYQDVQGLAEAHLIEWTHHRYLRTVQGHKHIREVEVTAAAELTSWDSFLEAAASYGVPDATLWACLIHDVTTQETALEPPMGLVSTRRWRDGFTALQAYRPRWHIEDDTYRELKEGWGLEKQHWGRDLAAAVGRTTLTCLAFNTAQVYRLRAGEHLATMAIRRLRELGPAPAVIYLAGCYGVFALEEVLSLLGTSARESLLPAVRRLSSTDAPTSSLSPNVWCILARWANPLSTLNAFIPANHPEMAFEAYYSLNLIRYQPAIEAVSPPKRSCRIAAFSRHPSRCYPLSYRPSLLCLFCATGLAASDGSCSSFPAHADTARSC